MVLFDIIRAKTTDGRDISLDGYKVESFATYRSDLQDIIEIVFRSGQTVQVIVEEGTDLQSSLVASMQVAKTEIETPNTCCLVDYETTSGQFGIFDGNATEFLISFKQGGKDCLEVHFSSGKDLSVFADSLDIKYDICEEDIENLVTDYIFRRNN